MNSLCIAKIDTLLVYYNITSSIPWISIGNLLLVVGTTNFHSRLATKLYLDNLLLCLHSYRSENYRKLQIQQFNIGRYTAFNL